MTEISPALLELLSAHNIGGVILFSENIKDVAQLITLNYTMQQHMVKKGRPPLFIAVDQEGGRVARLPATMLSPFAGNMAIGASFHQHGTAFAQNIAAHIGQTLLPLGINTNFAPSVDVNSEPKNPVINIRSFSEQPQHVAAMGEDFVKAMQRTGVISAIKHFPGHGDTYIDSHTGLPRVAHTRSQAMAGDVLPFASIINGDSAPAMVMTAHIQYPSLDNTTVMDKKGQMQTVPATLSKRIITDLLRTQLGYQGLVVTDALDMGGIAQFFEPEDAMVNAFQAGADIALMPFTIRNQNDIQEFNRFMERVAEQLRGSKEDRDMLTASHNRISKVKQRFQLQKFVGKPQSWWIDEAKARGDSLNPNSHKRKGIQLGKALSEAAVTVLYGKSKLPLTHQGWLALMPDTARCFAFESAVVKSFNTLGVGAADIQFGCLPLTALPSKRLTKRLISEASVLVVGDITPEHANYELGGLDSKESVAKRASQSEVHAFTKDMMQFAKSKDKTVVFAPLRMPYMAGEVKPFTDIAIATFSYVVTVEPGLNEVSVGQGNSPVVNSHVFNALTQVLTGQLEAQGRSPVTMTPATPESKQK
ncbi:glycoside hydrolase family 3 protein [Alteromonas sp. D210916BOD_24]